ncbi:comE operon protein 1 [bacterium BMS3Bbin14]|nr:comE operon protein 1 [bacterium BMS3Abin13]GBE51674.1 comE operon protein 1 [bacterium BMS3Bbin14]HDL98052.1 helix-hairpin-helix domain-containing protein [Desulfobacteraceae bacterium]
MKKLCLSIVLFLFLVTSAFAMVNINTAGVKELATLSGIGPAKAAAIVLYRKNNGQFKNTKDLIRVKGIGPNLMKKIEKEIKVGK